MNQAAKPLELVFQLQRPSRDQLVPTLSDREIWGTAMIGSMTSVCIVQMHSCKTLHDKMPEKFEKKSRVYSRNKNLTSRWLSGELLLSASEAVGKALGMEAITYSKPRFVSSA